jgi:hypothetical protein
MKSADDATVEKEAMGSRDLPWTGPEQQVFCQTGKLPPTMQRLPLFAKHRGRLQLALYKAYCPCTPGKEPLWVQSSPYLRQTYFPRILKRKGHATYIDAIDALTDYRQRHKSFYPKWSAIELAAREAFIKLNESETVAVVDATDSVWEEFAKNAFDAGVSSLRGKVEGALKEAAQKGMQMSERAKLRMTILEKHLEFIGLLQTIHEGVQARRLASLRNDDPEAIEFKVRYFSGLAVAKGPDYFDFRRQYLAYEKAHNRLVYYVGMENDPGDVPMTVDAPKRPPSTKKRKPWEFTSESRLPADTGLPASVL